MKKQHLAMIVSTILCFSATLAEAQEFYYVPPAAGPYFDAGIGPSFFQDGKLTQFSYSADNKVQFDTGLAADMSIGYSFNRFFAMDFEAGYIGTRIREVDGFASNGSRLSNVPLMFNGVLTLPSRHNRFVPYLGAGIGPSVSMFDAHNFNDGVVGVDGREADTVLGWQLFAGLRFQINPQISLGVGYKYFATGDPTFSYPPSPNWDVSFRGVRTHSVMVTFNCKFW